jgi:fused signal recognition particle receptor
MWNWFRKSPPADREDQVPSVTSEETPATEPLEPETVEASLGSVEQPEEPPADHAQDPGPGIESVPTTAAEDLDEAADDLEIAGKGHFFQRLRERLHRTREQFADRLDRLVLGKKTLGLDIADELEEILITSDFGGHTAQALLRSVTEGIQRKELQDAGRLREQLRHAVQDILSVQAVPWTVSRCRPFIVMVVGVNGVGKTTTIGKMAFQLQSQGHRVLLAAADTFRAAAVEQLSLWGERAQVPVVRQKTGSDPSAVAFDAIDAALARSIDVVLLDTAGRMHTKVNLMEELKKIRRVIQKKIPDAPHETLLVLDATTGQNALAQARLFKEEIGVTGIILTKLDGTAKGGIIVGICDELKVPVRFIGIGERIEDLRPFDPEEFTGALF